MGIEGGLNDDLNDYDEGYYSTQQATMPETKMTDGLLVSARRGRRWETPLGSIEEVGSDSEV